MLLFYNCCDIMLMYLEFHIGWFWQAKLQYATTINLLYNINDIPIIVIILLVDFIVLYRGQSYNLRILHVWTWIIHRMMPTYCAG